MKLSEITVENYKEVYKHFGDLQLNQKSIKRWFAFANAFLKPRVQYARGARKDLDLIRDKDYHHLYAFNHRNDWDGYVMYSILHQIAPYDVGNIRALANSISFEARRFRPFARISKSIGFIPAFLKTYYTNGRRHKNHPERLALLPIATEAVFDCFIYVQTEHRQKVLVCPEGMYNKGAPDTLLTIRRGAGEIAQRVAQLDGPAAITPIAFAYGKKNRSVINPRNTSVFVERSIFVTPDMTVDEITEQIRKRLQASVEKAVELY